MFIRKPLFYMAEGDGGSGDGAGDGGASGGSGASGDAGNQGGSSDDQVGKGDEGKTFTQADIDRIIAGRLSKYADYDAIKGQLAELQAANQTESEKAINAAKEEGRAEVRIESGKAIALEVFNGAAARRNAEYDTKAALELLDLGKFVKEDGSVDRDAVTKAVEQIVPEKEGHKRPPTFGGGARKTSDKAEVAPGRPRLRAAYENSSHQ
jgi:hypothetical protein